MKVASLEVLGWVDVKLMVSHMEWVRLLWWYKEPAQLDDVKGSGKANMLEYLLSIRQPELGQLASTEALGEVDAVAVLIKTSPQPVDSVGLAMLVSMCVVSLTLG